MTELKIVAPEELDIKKISVTEPKKKNDRLQSIILFGGSPFYLQTPEEGRAPFGVRSFAGDKSGDKKGAEKPDYSLNISLNDTGSFVKFLRDLDEYMLDFGIEHSKIIFKQKYTSAQKEVVRAMYTSCVKVSEDGDYPPRIAVKIQKKSAEDVSPQILFFHSETEEVEIESFEQLTKLIPNGSNVKALISLRPWFISGRFGITMTLQQILVPKRSGGRPTSYAFNDKTGAVATKIPAAKAAITTEDDDEVEDVPAEDEEHTEPDSVEDSDVAAAVEDEEEEEEEEEVQTSKKNVKKAVAAPAPTAVKKPVAKAPSRK